MKIKKYNPKVSILIINYNNKKFIKKSIDSVLQQNYSNLEIIFFDDNSTDNSLEILKKYNNKNIFLIKNKQQTKFGSYNQLNGYFTALKNSSGELIFFLDSDDYFHKNKVKKIVSSFLENPDKEMIMDLPIHVLSNKFIKKKKIRFLNNYWPQFSPQSCICVRRNFAFNIFKEVNFKKFPNIWLDFRIAVYAKYLSKYISISEYLTYYRQIPTQISSDFTFFSKKWWIRRLEAHNYIKYFFKLKKISYKSNLDFSITKFVNFLFRII